MGRYADQLNASRHSMSSEQIHRAKCSKKKARNQWRKEQNKLVQEECDNDRTSPEERLKILDFRLGKGVGAESERKRLKKQLAEAKKFKDKGQKIQKPKEMVKSEIPQEEIAPETKESETRYQKPIMTWDELKKGFPKGTFKYAAA